MKMRTMEIYVVVVMQQLRHLAHMVYSASRHTSVHNVQPLRILPAHCPGRLYKEKRHAEVNQTSSKHNNNNM